MSARQLPRNSRRSIRLQPSIISLSPASADATSPGSDFRTLRRRLAALQAENVALRERCEQAEEAVHQGQKLAAVGQLTTGIAHDFANLITGIEGSLWLGQSQIERGSVAEAERILDLALQSAVRASALTRRLLAFARQQPFDPEPVAVNELVAGMTGLVRQAAGANVSALTVLAPEPWRTLCDANQLETVLLNLCINARDAMAPSSSGSGGRGACARSDDGQLTVETRNTTVHEDDTLVQRRGLTPGDYVALSITDNGIGMPPEVAARACEPFFTTKPAGAGTGLGLNQACRFAEQAGGAVVIDSELGHGTKVTVLLPRYASDGDRFAVAGE